MFGLFGKSKRKKEIKSTFKEYGYEIQKFKIGARRRFQPRPSKIKFQKSVLDFSNQKNEVK